jgi:hypothetical protein
MCLFSLPPGYTRTAPAAKDCVRLCRTRGRETFVPLIDSLHLSGPADHSRLAQAQRCRYAGPIPIGRRVAASACHARQQRLRRPIIGEVPERRPWQVPDLLRRGL